MKNQNIGFPIGYWQAICYYLFVVAIYIYDIWHPRVALTSYYENTLLPESCYPKQINPTQEKVAACQNRSTANK